MNKFHWFVRKVIGPLIRIVMPTMVKGVENLPKSGAMLCPNHSSNWDPVLVFISLPGDYNLRTMAKHTLFNVPVLGWIIEKLGGFPVDRGSMDIQAVKTAMQAVKDGGNLMIFPEGQRVSAEGEVEAKGGVAVIGVRTGATMIPVFVDGEKKPFHRTRIIFGDPYEPVYTGRHGTSEEMQKIADDLLAQAYALGGQAVGGMSL